MIALRTANKLNIDVTRLAWPALLLAGLGVRLPGLYAALWYDEAFSAWLAQLPLINLIEATITDVHPPGYYLLLWAINQIAGHSEPVLRLPSLLAGLGLIYVVFRLAQALELPERTAWLAAIITAASPFQVYYSQEARSYALLTLCVALAALWLAEHKFSRAVLASVAALYLHNIGIIFVVSLWGLAVMRMAEHGHAEWNWKPWLLSLAGLPGLVITSYQAGNVAGGYWVPPITSPGRLLAVLDDLLWFTPNNPFVIATGLITAISLLAMLLELRRRRPAVLNLAWMVLVPLLLFTLASLLAQPVLISRIMAPAAPFFIIWLAATVGAPTLLWAWSALAVPTAALILTGPLWGAGGREPLDRDMISLYGQYQPGDAIYHANVGSYVVWDYYRPDIPQFVWPQHTSLSQTLTDPTRTAMGMHEINFEYIKCVNLPQEGGQIERWWLIYFHNPVTDPAEIEYVDYLTTSFPARPVKQLRSDATVEAWLVQIDPECSHDRIP